MRIEMHPGICTGHPSWRPYLQQSKAMLEARQMSWLSSGTFHTRHVWSWAALTARSALSTSRASTSACTASPRHAEGSHAPVMMLVTSCIARAFLAVMHSQDLESPKQAESGAAGLFHRPPNRMETRMHQMCHEACQVQLKQPRKMQGELT